MLQRVSEYRSAAAYQKTGVCVLAGVNSQGEIGGQRSDKDPSQTWIVISAKVLDAN